MRLRIVLTMCAVLALSVGAATATAGGGNSAKAKACQQGGWQTWVRADLTSFRNEGDCVSYAARGGTLTSPKTQSQIDCEALGGTFSTNPADDQFGSGTTTYVFVWSCNDATSPISQSLTDDCAAEPNFAEFVASNSSPYDASCYRS